MIKILIFFAVGWLIGFVSYAHTSRHKAALLLGFIFLILGIIIGGIE